MQIKICGLSDAHNVETAARVGARYLGFMFFEPSPRNLSIVAARALMLTVPEGLCKVALTVDADDAFLDRLMASLPIDMLQLHGQETPDRVARIRSNYGLPVMKAVGVADEGDLSALLDYTQVADQLLVDAKPPKTATLPGGNGVAFDWRLIAGRRWAVPWMLAGGLTPDNVADAIRLTGATQVDVSTGVESAPGIKDADKIRAFAKAANGG